MLDQSASITGCPWCQILYPEAAECPRCEGAGQLVPSRMMDGPTAAREIAKAAKAFEHERNRERLDALLELLLLHRPVLPAAPSLDALRRADATLLPNVEGKSEAQVLALFGDPVTRQGDVWTYRNPGPANHERWDVELVMVDGRVHAQRSVRVTVACDPEGASP